MPDVRAGHPAHRLARWGAGASGVLLVACLAGCAGATPKHTPASSASVVRSATPSSTPSDQTSSTGWSGRLRPGPAMPVRSLTMYRPAGADSVGDLGAFRWDDGADAALAEIDIRQIRVQDISSDGRMDWSLVLAGPYPSALTLAKHHRVIEYGIVLDTDADGDADCQLGINNDATTPSDFRVWLQNVNSGTAEERVGGPYGIPFDFKHPGENQDGSEQPDARMTFWFLNGAPYTPCDTFGSTRTFYAWAVELEDGKVKAFDYAPDAAWVLMP